MSGRPWHLVAPLGAPSSQPCMHRRRTGLAAKASTSGASAKVAQTAVASNFRQSVSVSQSAVHRPPAGAPLPSMKSSLSPKQRRPCSPQSSALRHAIPSQGKPSGLPGSVATPPAPAPAPAPPTLLAPLSPPSGSLPAPPPGFDVSSVPQLVASTAIITPDTNHETQPEP